MVLFTPKSRIKLKVTPFIFTGTIIKLLTDSKEKTRLSLPSENEKLDCALIG